MQTIQSTPWKPSALADSPSTAPTDSTAAGAGTITANDFLTLLVTELKNQDPTANTDPNAYVNQLVQVNSLQQLIQINQDTTPQSAPTANTPTATS
jgi:flagellar basal-body rod modification protein FlgD